MFSCSNPDNKNCAMLWSELVSKRHAWSLLLREKNVCSAKNRSPTFCNWPCIFHIRCTYTRKKSLSGENVRCWLFFQAKPLWLIYVSSPPSKNIPVLEFKLIRTCLDVEVLHPLTGAGQTDPSTKNPGSLEQSALL